MYSSQYVCSSNTKQGDKYYSFSRTISKIHHLLWAKFKPPKAYVTFKYFWKCKVSLQHKVTAGTGVMLTGQGSITPEAFPSVSSNPNRAFGISSVLESLMSLALDLCLLMLSLVCLQEITTVPVLFLPFPCTSNKSQATLHFCRVDSSFNSVRLQGCWFKDGKF